MSRRPGMFRGSELPRMLLLLGVMVFGWIGVVIYLLTRTDPPPPPRPVAQVPPLPPPDDAPELRGLEDRARMSPRDNAGYALLLKRIRETPPAELARQARREIVYSQLFENPQRFRGLPFHLEGHTQRVILQDAIDPKLVPSGRFYEAYVTTPDSQKNLITLVFEEPPPTLPVGDRVLERFRFDGYFFRLVPYRAGDGKAYATPVFIGRLAHEVSTGPTGPSRSLFWTLSPLLLLFLYVVARWAFHLRRVLRPKTRPRRGPLPTDEIAPEELASWIEQPARDEDVK